MFGAGRFSAGRRSQFAGAALPSLAQHCRRAKRASPGWTLSRISASNMLRATVNKASVLKACQAKKKKAIPEAIIKLRNEKRKNVVALVRARRSRSGIFPQLPKRNAFSPRVWPLREWQKGVRERTIAGQMQLRGRAGSRDRESPANECKQVTGKKIRKMENRKGAREMRNRRREQGQ